MQVTPRPNRRAAGAMWCRREDTTFHLPAPIPIDALSGPQGSAQTQALEHPTDASLERHSRGPELGMYAGHIETNPDAEDEAPRRDLVERSTT